MTFSFCDMDYSESSVEKKKKVNKTMFQICSLLYYSINLQQSLKLSNGHAQLLAGNLGSQETLTNHV